MTSEIQNRDLMIIVGAEKVPPAIYDLADLNVAAGSQPHSEVAALALLLDHLQDGRELTRTFDGVRHEIIPMRKGKRVIEQT